MQRDWEVIVIGAGAAGLLASTRSAERGRRTLLLEKTSRVGTKILMSGGTRCNLTQNTDVKGIVAAFGTPGKFLHSALSRLGPKALVELVEAEGVPTKVEETGKIFPVSDKAADVQNALLRRLIRSGAEIRYSEPVLDISKHHEGFIVQTMRAHYACRKLILATGGLSYPGSGTTGDAYPWAVKLGHTLNATRPALTPIIVNADWVRALQGITLPDMGIEIRDPNIVGKGGLLDRRRGSVLFTHFGLSGPPPLDASRHVSGHPRPQELRVMCDFFPQFKIDQLEDRWRQLQAEKGKLRIGLVIPDLIVRRVGETLLHLAEISSDQRLAELPRLGRRRLVEVSKGAVVPVGGTLGYKKAEVTAGGIPLEEIDSRTMESKRVPGLYAAGELLDLDGPIGGFNFQAAFSTGWLAGESV